MHSLEVILAMNKAGSKVKPRPNLKVDLGKSPDASDEGDLMFEEFLKAVSSEDKIK